MTLVALRGVGEVGTTTARTGATLHRAGGEGRGGEGRGGEGRGGEGEVRGAD